ncbi:response regulator [Undibacterium sp. TS12]|uniref:hybrid sensor histidine kinase/response regulator n=1 Tax=Undibacterium sp. TS12 TaxID=2908202 RepID=UPI001F4D2B62|nr:response regulator [Undibacterium sp. TS12]MCH8621824.1 response regulator [Undibacterium sp. TS12]
MEQLENHATDFSHIVLGALDEVFNALEADTVHSTDVSEVTRALACYIEQLRRIRAAASAADMPGLHWVCALIERNLISLHNQNRHLSEEEYCLLNEWPDLLASHALNHGDKNIETLITHLSTASWPLPLSQIDSNELRQLLNTDPLTPVDESEDPPPLFLVPSVESVSEKNVEGEAEVNRVDANTVTNADAGASENSNSHRGEDTHPVPAPGPETVAETQDISVTDVLDAEIEQSMDLNLSSGLHDAIDALVMTLAADENFGHGGESDTTTLQCYAAQLQAFSTCASQLAMHAIADASHGFADVVSMRSETRQTLDETELAILNRFPLMLMDGIADPENPELVAGLLDVIYDPVWNKETPDLLTQTEPEPNDTSFEHRYVAGQEISEDMLHLFAKEFGLMSDMLAEDLAAVMTADQEKLALAKQNYVDALVRVGSTAASVGLTALNQLLGIVASRVASVNGAPDDQQHALLGELPSRLLNYLQQPTDEVAALELLSLVLDAAWPAGDAPPAGENLFAELINVQVTVAEGEGTEEAIVVTASDVSLQLPDDLNTELFDGLLQELPVQVNNFTSAIEKFSSGTGSMQDIEQAKRAAHTLKGAANTVGVAGIANLTHHLEDLLIGLGNTRSLPDKDLADLLTEAGDCLEAMGEAVMGSGSVPEQAQEILQQVCDHARLMRNGESGVEQIKLVTEDDAVDQKQPSAEMQTGGVVLDLVEPGSHAAEPMLRVPAKVIDELLRLAGENVISNAQIQEQLKQTQKQSKAIQKHDILFQKLIADLETLVDVRGMAGPQKMASINAHDGDFDPLEFERYSELHTITAQLVEARTDAFEMSNHIDEQLKGLAELLEVQRRLQMENQHAVIRTRLVPVTTVVSRLQRSVRQTCRLLDKQVNLNILGANTNIDSNMLNDLTDPLMHILRNAVDHGIEDAGARHTARKPVIGQIELSFAREGSSIVVRCKDDGAGLDYEAIRRTAIKRRMISADRILSEEELARLILMPGFSTREISTQTSGRGIGMDMVHARILEMKGSLNLRSVAGQGLVVELRLPASLLSEHTLMARVGGNMMAISSRRIIDIHYITDAQIDMIADQQVYRVGDAVHKLLKLEQLLNMPARQKDAHSYGYPVLLISTDTGATCAIQVPELVDGREVVVKKFGRYVPRIQGTIGAVILGDGSVAPVIDLPELLRASTRQEFAVDEAYVSVSTDTAAQVSHVRTALIVDDSLSARRATAQIMRDAGYEIRTAIDGLDAVARIDEELPDVILVDMEMPRMNGLELTSHVRARKLAKHIPIIMITSRSTQKHRQQGDAAGVDAYLVKPFSADALLQHINRLTGNTGV